MNTPPDLQAAALSRDGQNLHGLQSRICTRVRTLFGAWLTAPFLYLLLFWPTLHLEIFHQRQFFFSLSFWWCTISHPETKYLGENLIQFGFFGTPNFFTFSQQEKNICMKLHENEHFPSNPTHPPFWLTKFSTRCIILQFKDTAHQNMILLQQTVHLCQYYKQFSEFSWKPQLQLSHRYSMWSKVLVKDFIEYPI